MTASEPARRVTLVTGGAQGLGAAVSRQMAARGWSVAIADVNEAGAQATAQACGEAAFAIGVDLARAAGPVEMIQQTVRRAGRLDVLVNCAAVAPAEAFLDMTAEAWEQALLVNVRAVALAMAAAGRVMAAQGGGRIINATSAAARMALPNYAAYAATKAAVDSLARSAAVALAPHGVRVNSISPGMMDTPLQQRTRRYSVSWRDGTTSQRSRPSAPRASRSGAGATPRRWQPWRSGLPPTRPTT
jgi:NAD(P)-dependent dehydrogenase (short-subunit alcohol dehydrogenase family)